MPLVTMIELLDEARVQHRAIPSFCFWNLESAQAILRAAARVEAPVILMTGPGEFPLARPAELAAVVRHLITRYPVRAALHLDHGSCLEEVKECLEAGFTSVMLDYSAKPFDENVAGLLATAAMAKPLGATVEGEIGHVGKVDNVTKEGIGESTLTVTQEAVDYVAQTGVDALAVSIGNAHGQYTRLPRLDFDRLAEIRTAINIPLVLHGGSGTPDADLKRAISLGIAKVNVATELITAVRQSLLEQWQAGQNLWTPGALAVAYQTMEPVVEKWITRTKG
jgi:ketose-bisphosphate aldolase